jgi:MFS transporter, FSR family, fosmidomycin resistance protein
MTLGAAGVITALVMLANSGVLRDDAGGRQRRQAARRGTAGDIRLLLSAPILMSLLFFVMLSLSQGGYMSFSVSALEALYRIPLVEATVPLTIYLFLSAAGVLAGGWVADRTRHHARVVGACFVIVALATALVPQFVPPLAVTAVLFGVAGFFSGLVAPARDMMVRAVTPPGATGKVFGFVTTGFNIGGIIAPLLFGLVLDFADPRLVFWLIALLSALTLIVVFGTGRSRGTAEPASAPH